VSDGIVLVHRAMSLDGFIAGPDNEMDWIFDYAAPEVGADVMATTGAMLSGRHTYEVGRRSAAPETNAAYGGAWSGAQFVLTHRAKTAEDDDAVIFLSGDVGDAVATGLVAAGGKNLEVLGTDVTVQCLARGLVDEIYVHVLPVLLGAGVPLFRTVAITPVRLEPMISSTNGTVSSLRFRVSKEP
jgi:dihydrofolate reductase